MKFNFIFYALIDAKYKIGYEKKINSFCYGIKKNNHDIEKKIFTNTSLFGLIIFQLNIIFSSSKIIFIRSIGERTFLLLPSFILMKILNKKIILEIPSPLTKLKFEKNMKSIKNFIYISVNTFFLKSIFFLSYKVLIYDKEMIDYKRLNNKFILLSNGVQVNKYKSITNKKKIINNLNFIFLGYLSRWHGLEKLFFAMIEYTKSNGPIKINLYIYGEVETNYLKDLKKIINKNKLDNYINFNLGIFSYEHLYAAFSNCHVGVGSLSLNLSKSYYRSELKIREYCSTGLPFVFNSRDLDFQPEFKYAYNLRLKSLNITDIIKWYEDLPEDTSYNLNTYAKENLDYDKKIKSLLSKLNL